MRQAIFDNRKGPKLPVDPRCYAYLFEFTDIQEVCSPHTRG